MARRNLTLAALGFAGLVALVLAPWWLLLAAVTAVAGFAGGIAARPALESRWERRFNRPAVEAPPAPEPEWADPFNPWGGGR